MKRIYGLKHVLTLVCLLAFIGMFSFPALAADAAIPSGKTGNLSPLYGFIAAFSLLLVAAYALWRKKCEKKFLLLFCCVAIANCGYFMLSVSGSLSAALWANRISYFGCAFAVLMMLLIIADVCRVRLSAGMKAILIGISSAAFLLAASGGWLTIYYSAVHIETVNGMTVLVKSYAPLHIAYTLYIAVYFILKIAIIIWANRNNRISSVKYAVFLAAVVLGNIAVWGVEQLIDIEFEFLSISYMATAVFLLLMRLVIEDYNRLCESGDTQNIIISPVLGGEDASAKLPPDMENLFKTFAQRVDTLTASERMVLQYQIDGYNLEETAEKLFISVNTARKHNTNLRRKLEINSREELNVYIDLFRRAGRIDEITYME